MRQVYDLRLDQERVTMMQGATLTTEQFGIEPTHGLVGSVEWWQQIEDGRLPKRTVRGTITKVYMSGHNDWPEFEVEEESGEFSRWTREGNRREDDELYRAGRRVEIDFVLQRSRFRFPTGPDEIKTVLWA